MNALHWMNAGVSLALLCAGCAATAAADERTAALSEKCAKRVEQQIKERRSAGDSAGATVDMRYESHYNAKRDKCFVLQVVTGLEGEGPKDKAAPVEIQALWDADENRQYGWFKGAGSAGMQAECFVQKTACRGKEEWKRLIKPFLEE